jgi:hypothetical protein
VPAQAGICAQMILLLIYNKPPALATNFLEKSILDVQKWPFLCIITYDWQQNKLTAENAKDAENELKINFANSVVSAVKKKGK